MITAVVFMAIGIVFLVIGAVIVQTLPGRGVLTLIVGASMLVGGFVGYIEWRDDQCHQSEICLDR